MSTRPLLLDQTLPLFHANEYVLLLQRCIGAVSLSHPDFEGQMCLPDKPKKCFVKNKLFISDNYTTRRDNQADRF